MICMVVITGLSGSGKSTAIRALEDQGFYCVDNLPIALLPKFVELCEESGEVSKVGVGLDARGRGLITSLPGLLKELKSEGHDIEIIFLESADAVLVKRFSETRRIHPLAPSGHLLDGIVKERGMLAELRGEASRIVDTSEYNVHELKTIISGYVQDLTLSRKMSLNIVSFGFKYGILSEADIVMDVRFLPNPNFVDDLKLLTGEEKSVADYALGNETGEGFMDRFSDMVNYLIPNYLKEGKSYLTIGVGCTGGRHRSVAVVEALSKRLVQGEYDLQVLHRDKNRG